jgi:hypothetical protein
MILINLYNNSFLSFSQRIILIRISETIDKLNLRHNIQRTLIEILIFEEHRRGFRHLVLALWRYLLDLIRKLIVHLKVGI